MSIRALSVLLLGLTLLLLPACGGGGTTAEVDRSMNPFESDLVGEYQLADFRIQQPGRMPLVPERAEDWAGRMVLREDGSAIVTLDLCEEGGRGQQSCERTFRWSADAGLLRLHAVDSGACNVLLEWEHRGMGVLETSSFLPINVENCGLFLAGGAGGEVLTWVCSSP